MVDARVLTMEPKTVLFKAILKQATITNIEKSCWNGKKLPKRQKVAKMQKNAEMAKSCWNEKMLPKYQIVNNHSGKKYFKGFIYMA